MVLLLVMIYLAFICLGLPDSLLGSAWPSMYASLGVSIDSAGILSMIISVGTVLSSLLSGRVIRRFGTGRVTVVSVAMTAAALLGFSFSNSFLPLCVCAVPLGLGAGSIDAALNSFVALHYKAKHMSWLHCFWGVGASLGPVIMGYSLLRLQSWNAGYRVIGLLLFALTAVLLFSLPLFQRVRSPQSEAAERNKGLSIRQMTRLPGAKQILLAFFCYCALEATVGLWGSSYLVTIRGISETTAANWISLYYAGITLGRFLSGFLAMRLKNKQMVQLGQALIGAGIAVLLLPLAGTASLIGLFLVGLGCAPIYPSLIHDTPFHFGGEHAQTMIGLQMACAYIGTTCMPPLFGLLGANISYALFPVFLGTMLGGMWWMVVRLYGRRGSSPG